MLLAVEMLEPGARVAQADALVERLQRIVAEPGAVVADDEAQAIAETGDTKAYRKKLNESGSLDRESDEIASRLGAAGCNED